MKLNNPIDPASLRPLIEKFWQLSGAKILRIEKEYDRSKGTPVFTVDGRYTTRGWTEWTEGFQYGSAILQYDATGDETFLKIGREGTVDRMASHVSHFGVHDHGFNNLSTYGNLLRLQREGRLPDGEWETEFYKIALKVSASVQAQRWSRTADGGGYIYSFNGPHSLFVDTIRSCRILGVGHCLGHAVMTENDRRVSLLGRSIQHGLSTARFNIYYGEGRDSYDEWGRTAHEAVFNTNDGNFRCPNAQQGFSGFTTWTRGLAWAMVGYPEELEFFRSLPASYDAEFEPFGGKAAVEAVYLKAAKATCDWFIENTASDGIPYWDGGAPQLYQLGDYRNRPADPFNDFEPVDSSAAAIGAQGLIRLGRYLGTDTAEGKHYYEAGLLALKTLLSETYTSHDESHHGLVLHSIYHRPNGWDFIPPGRKQPCGESSMWGDYHARELVLYVQRLLAGEPEYTFYGCLKGTSI
ncbi:MAG: glycosyl hydrolase [Opitutales bacterium]|nr:glycosyl hydrolase [Opitutales bacterium]